MTSRLRWSTVTWAEFVYELRGFRARFYEGRSDEEHAYLESREKLNQHSWARDPGARRRCAAEP
ncbi:MAG: hypothetical protein QOD13_1641 [Thermoleophilaceae bacterium]|jgi:hypothetical protein|nr:hypothetical protein [Thermoleophilaceae bacterium]